MKPLRGKPFVVVFVLALLATAVVIAILAYRVLSSPAAGAH